MVSGSDLAQLFGEPPERHDSDEVESDAIQLTVVATFNGLCRLIAALARNGLLFPDQLADIEDAMTTPLDDPNWRDYSFIAETRDTVERVLASAVRRVTE